MKRCAAMARDGPDEKDVTFVSDALMYCKSSMTLHTQCYNFQAEQC